MSKKQNEAQRLASLIGYCVPSDSTSGEAAALLLRQDELLKQAQEALSKGTGWMEHGELIAAIRTHRGQK